MNDATTKSTDVQALAKARRDAGISDQQTAKAVAAAKARQAKDGDNEAHPS